MLAAGVTKSSSNCYILGRPVPRVTYDKLSGASWNASSS